MIRGQFMALSLLSGNSYQILTLLRASVKLCRNLKDKQKSHTNYAIPRFKTQISYYEVNLKVYNEVDFVKKLSRALISQKKHSEFLIFTL